jgi:hypothetical protein
MSRPHDAKVARKIQHAIENDVVEPVSYMTVLHHVRQYVIEHPIAEPHGSYWPKVEAAVKASLLKGYTPRDGKSS